MYLVASEGGVVIVNIALLSRVHQDDLHRLEGCPLQKPQGCFQTAYEMPISAGYRFPVSFTDSESNKTYPYKT